MKTYDDIFAYVTAQETAYELPVTVMDGYEWSMREHIRDTVMMRDSQLSDKRKGKADERPVKNIIRPILNLEHRTEGFDVKDIELYVDDPKEYYKSFFVRKYHGKWAVENGIDTFIDRLVESYVDFGGILAKKLEGQAAPEVVRLETIAFCDQTDILGGPIGIRHEFSPDRLKEMAEYGWGDEANGATITIDELLELSDFSKKNDKNNITAKTPGAYVEVYEVHGMLPEKYLIEDGDQYKFIRQMQIVAYFQDEKGDKQGVCLYRGKETESPFKFLARDEIYGRALGFGGAEELFEAQVWTNYGQIRKKELLDQAALHLYKTNDREFEGSNILYDKRTGDVLYMQEGKDFNLVDSTPRSIAIFDNLNNEWEEHARVMGSANDTSLSETPKSGTPFALQQLVSQEGYSLHKYRQGKIAVFVNEIYRDWIIPEMQKEIAKDQNFFAELDQDEMEFIADRIAPKNANNTLIQDFLQGNIQTQDQYNANLQQERTNFFAGGNKRFLEILKADFKKVPLNVQVNIVGKQKYQAHMVDKLVNVFRQIIAAPQMLDDPRMSKIFNQILEQSGLDPIDFYRKPQQQLPQQAQQPKLENLPTNQAQA